MSDTRGNHWPAGLPVARLRVARPTNRLQALRRFYGHGLGLVELGSFEGHAGYSGVFFGLPDATYHLEFTQHEAGSACPAPSKDNLLVLYFASASAVDVLAARLADLGYPAVEPENPYWATAVASVTVEDPDGWRVVLVKPGMPGSTNDAAGGPGSSRPGQRSRSGGGDDEHTGGTGAGGVAGPRSGPGGAGC